MKVFKFGGASIKDAGSIRNMKQIIDQYKNDSLVVVVSAMGKTTNNLEKVYEAAISRKSYEDQLSEVHTFHTAICSELFRAEHDIFFELDQWIQFLGKQISELGIDKKERLYDAIVSIGELLSSNIISEFLNDHGISVVWLDARKLIKTDDNYKEGMIDWEVTKNNIISTLEKNELSNLSITQGFIGSDPNGLTTTLGREGSDFSAAIFAYCLEAESVTIWKDVPGILNADPKLFSNTNLYRYLSYQEAAEMTYYGASVIHPKTIKPLANKQIPLLVKSFLEPEAAGTIIDKDQKHVLYPTFVIKENQCLVSFEVRDLSFINEKNLSVIFHILNQLRIKINMMQNSAVSLTVCFDYHPEKVEQLLAMLKNDFTIKYNEGLQLITVKNYNEKAIQDVSVNRNILVEQRTRNTFQIVVQKITGIV